jgi:hypothetical protein
MEKILSNSLLNMFAKSLHLPSLGAARALFSSKKICKIFQILRHIKSLDAVLNIDENKN